MKIAIPVDIQDGQAQVCKAFGRSPYYAIYITDTKELEFIRNPAITSPGGAGVQAAQWLVNFKVDIIISPRVGDNAFRVFESAKITMYEAIEGSVIENVEALSLGKLKAISRSESGLHR